MFTTVLFKACDALKGSDRRFLLVAIPVLAARSKTYFTASRPHMCKPENREPRVLHQQIQGLKVVPVPVFV
jgi:hypothetical protein